MAVTLTLKTQQREAQSIRLTLPLPDTILFIELDEHPGGAVGKELRARVIRTGITDANEIFEGPLMLVTDTPGAVGTGTIKIETTLTRIK